MMAIYNKAYWHPSKNLPVLEEDISKWTQNEFIFTCILGHDDKYSMKTFSSRRGGWCVYCSSQKVWIGFNDLASQESDIASEWHPTMNGTLKPTDVTVHSGKEVWWLYKCGHVRKQLISARTDTNKRAGCFVCGRKEIGRLNSLPKEGSIPLSVQFPYLLEKINFSKLNQTFNIDNYGPQSDFILPYKCKQCGHEWEATVAIGVHHNCRKCAVKERSKNRAYCDYKESVAYLYPHLLNEVHPTKNSADVDLEHLRPTNEIKLWWKCLKGHEWKAMVYSRATQDTRCKECGFQQTSKSEKALAIEIMTLASKTKLIECNVTGLIPNSKQEVDIYLSDSKIGFEYNGLFFHREAMKNKQYHQNKIEKFAEQDIQLFHIWENEWKLNKALTVQKINAIINPINLHGNSKVNLFTIPMNEYRKYYASHYQRFYKNGYNPILVKKQNQVLGYFLIYKDTIYGFTSLKYQNLFYFVQKELKRNKLKAVIDYDWQSIISSDKTKISKISLPIRLPFRGQRLYNDYTSERFGNRPNEFIWLPRQVTFTF